ncbi:inositol oxygenase isoform X2 [Leucoraja erinacea]|uniref:inositol oxygenase isoform X2 n=1 Tax=Leucoraja erinaceus TaxID=7782 RepID=UPI0024537F16|nr:inositol oxygenase isoform X2 [Leucoraja erinacea]XP_055509194.1 inositol oxygenase isoform X2 [Leucoraja erinacea]XP_055509195.1 inositol oxygenase isoform X2 [Leucoraja erinacea]
MCFNTEPLDQVCVHTVTNNNITNKSNYRNFEYGVLQDRVLNTYRLMHTYQTVEFVKRKISRWVPCLQAEMTVMEALQALDHLVDESDPDVDFPNSFHAYQTAEGIRNVHRSLDWLHLVGLLHDIGKILSIWGEPQWCVVGDTYPVGCRFQESIVYRNNTFADNPDLKDARYSSLCGIYEPNCGLEKVMMSWGHDEYLYNVLKTNGCKLPEEGLYMIRYHSFYPWHTKGDYMHLCNHKDLNMLQWVKEFNKFDLYTKNEDLPDIKKLQPYYQQLIDKYCPGKLRW